MIPLNAFCLRKCLLKGSSRVREDKFEPLGILWLAGHEALSVSSCQGLAVPSCQRLAPATAAPSGLAFLLLLASNLLGNHLYYLTEDD